MGSRLSMRSSASKHSGTASRLSLRRRQPPTPTGAAQPELDIARQVAEGREANWPELHCGLAYNVTTKRLQVSVLRANRLRIPEASLRSPSRLLILFTRFEVVLPGGAWSLRGMT